MGLSRRHFLQSSAFAVAFAGLERAVGARGLAPVLHAGAAPAPPSGPLALLPGFRQAVLSPAGAAMDDGLLVPGYHDGMGAFAARDGRDSTVILVRNHEIDPSFGTAVGPFGPSLERLATVDRSLVYDAGFGVPCLGGTTTLVYDTKERRLTRHFLSLVGTGNNCAGGATPWGTWISCEEWPQDAQPGRFERSHGWAFEVPADANGSLVAPRRLPALGRFRHEAVACDPARPIVYLTEDENDGCLYRFVAARQGDLGAGRLQALVAIGKPGLDTRNWPAEAVRNGTTERVGAPVISVRPKETLAARWMDLDEIDAPKGDLRHRAFAQGAMRFARSEGIWLDGETLHFAATTGGPRELGQIWRYRQSPHEGTPAEADSPPTIELLIESIDSRLLENADNLTVAPPTNPLAGEMFLCEDGAGTDGIVRVRPDGSVRRFAQNVANDSELAGVCFSPDGSTLFVNVQHPGATIAVTGPWEALR